MKKVKRLTMLLVTATLSLFILGCANTSLPPTAQILEQNPLTASQLKQIFIGKTFSANVTRGRFGGRYKAEIKSDNKVIIDDGRHYRAWRLEGNKVCIESCFLVYANEKTPNTYYAIVDNQIDLILRGTSN